MTQPELKLPAKVAGAIVIIASAIPMISAVVAGLDPQALGLSQEDLARITSWLALAGGLVNIPVVLLRLNIIPGITSGNGLEPRVDTTTTTLEVTESHTP